MSEELKQPDNTTFTSGWSAFSTDWFSHRIPQWEQYIKPALAGKKCRWLELGSYEGRSAIWTLDNILTHAESSIDCVDIWMGQYEKNFDGNMKGRSKVRKYKKNCLEFLANTLDSFQFFGNRCIYDAVYVDADHQAKAALTEACLAWELLKPGGFMIFDDYPWEHPVTDPQRHRKLGPKKGIDAFLECWQYELTLLHKGWQVIVQKLPPS